MEDASEAWETIVEQSGKNTGDLSMINYRFASLVIARLTNTYHIVQAMVTNLSFKVNDLYIEDLEQLGYTIDTTSDQTYADSLLRIQQSSRNLITKIKTKRNALNMKSKDDVEEPSGYEELLAGISVALGFQVSGEITLSAFNVYRKLIKEKNKPKDHGIN